MAGATTIEVNGVPVSATAPLPVQLQTGGTVGDVNAKQWGGVALAPGVGSVAAQAYTSIRALADSVMRGDDGATYSAVSIRRVDTVINEQSNIAVYARAAMAMLDISAASGSRGSPVAGIQDASGTNHGPLGVVEARRSGYWASRLGRRFTVKSPNITGVAGATSLTTTAPTYLLVNGATNEMIVRRIKATMKTINGATTSEMLIKTDTADRFSAGGTTRTPVTMNNGNVVSATQARSLEAPTATAEGGGTRDVDCISSGITQGSQIIYEPEDGLIVAASGSLLLYLVSATGAATYDVVIEYEDTNIQ